MQVLLGLVLLWVSHVVIAADADAHLVLRFCEPGLNVADIDAARDCTLRTRPELADDYGTKTQLILARVEQVAPGQDTLAFWVTPYYLRKITFFEQVANGWQSVAAGGAVLGADLDSARLGGHRFEVPVEANTASDHHAYLIQVDAPQFAHLSIRLDDKARVSNKQELMLALHLGMLSLLFLLVLSAWVIRPAELEARLAVLTGSVLLSVLIGSGVIYQLWPDASTHWVGFFLFNAAVAVRIGAITWVYALLIGPYNDRKSYQALNWLTYVVTAVAVALFAVNLPAFGWPLVAMLLLLALFTPAWGLWTARPMPRLLSTAVLVSVLFYLGLNVFAFYSLMHTTGQNDWPVYAIRVVDLALPLMLFALVILRNRVADRELEQAKSEVSVKAAELDAQRRVNEEKRMLLDMLTHEVKNPLASIRFAVRNLTQPDNTASSMQTRRLESIRQSVQSIDEIIERCNLANGLEDETIEPQVEPLHLDDLVRDLVQSSEQQSRINVSISAVPGIESDPYLIRIVLANLLDNALKYAHGNTPIDVTIVEQDKAIRLSVANDISPDVELTAEQLFDRYYRHESAQRIRGSGLGLALSRSVCALIGARISCNVLAGHIQFEVTFDEP